ncbi:adenylyltransferase/cytidyltransferase family protein [Candidatus Woesearchaeota archaeon]|nr:adenylyltransferase/cytidyltransferase family protein [Candidatus Woesearchaeota archaeon]
MNSKIKTKEELKSIVESLKSQKKTIVTTNGTFDILHIAHLRLLEKAKSLGDILIVLVNSDSSVKKLKGDKRPIIPEQERAEVLSYLKDVDYITLFSEDKPIGLLKEIKPNVHVKGGSFILGRIKEEKELLESWNGQFKTFNLEEGYSTTNIIQKIIDSNVK